MGGGYKVEADLNLDGLVDGADIGLLLGSSGTYRTPDMKVSTLGNTIGYAGYLYDAAAGLHLSRFRWYDAVTGRWMNRDPIRYKGGSLNLYLYVGASPIRFSDPFGLIGPPGLPPLGPKPEFDLYGIPSDLGPGTLACDTEYHKDAADKFSQLSDNFECRINCLSRELIEAFLENLRDDLFDLPGLDLTDSFWNDRGWEELMDTLLGPGLDEHDPNEPWVEPNPEEVWDVFEDALDNLPDHVDNDVRREIEKFQRDTKKWRKGLKQILKTAKTINFAVAFGKRFQEANKKCKAACEEKNK